MKYLLPLFLLAAATAAPAASPDDQARALETLKRSIGFRTVDGQEGNQVQDYAAYLKSVLIEAGFAERDIEIVPLGGTASFTARYPGSDAKAKPILFLAHMDVVDARREDWERDPFTAIVENGYVHGRGAADNKGDLSMLVTAFAKLRREGWKPRRDLILAFSGDEETMMKTTRALAAKFKHAEYAINADSGGGLMGENGKPTLYSINAAEKTYADFTLTVTDKGGHSSAPTSGNPIYRLARALDKVSAYRFPAMTSEINRLYYRVGAANAEGPIKAAMLAYAANPEDAAAIATLSERPEHAGRLRTTCVATEIKGGHAVNALPQRATANINCRIFPGVAVAEVQATLAKVMDDPTIRIAQVDSGSIESAPSPLRPDIVAAITKAINGPYPGVPIVPAMSSGASDSMHFRAAGVPSYGASGVFAKTSERSAHGLNERFPLAAIPGALDYWDSLIRTVGSATPR